MTKKNNIKMKGDAEQRIGVMLEHFDSRFDQVLEGQAALDTKFDKKIDELRYELRDEIELLKVGQMGLSHRVEDLVKSSKQILEYLSKIDDEIKDLTTKLNKKADLERLERVEKEVMQIKLAIQKWQK